MPDILLVEDKESLRRVLRLITGLVAMALLAVFFFGVDARCVVSP